MAKVTFYLKDKNKTGERPINLRVRHKNTLADDSKIINSKIALKDLKNGELKDGNSIRGNSQFAVELRDKLNKIKYLVENQIPTQLEQEIKRTPSAKEIVEKLRQEMGLAPTKTTSIQPKNDTTFFGVYAKYIEHLERTKAVKPVVIGKRDHVRKVLLNYCKSRNFDLTFEGINMSFYDDFVFFLAYEYIPPSRQNSKSQVAGITDNTIGSYIKILKIFMNWANEYEFTTAKGHTKKGFTVTNKPADIVVFSEEELNKIIYLDLSPSKVKLKTTRFGIKAEEISTIRDILVVGCCTGLRINDLLTIPLTSVHLDSKTPEDSYIRVIPKKTSGQAKVVSIPLAQPAYTILKKYRGKFSYALPTEFPTGRPVTSHAFNRGIKAIAMLAGIDEDTVKTYVRNKQAEQIEKKKYALFSAHRMRATFITMMLRNGVNAETVMEMSGHSDYKSFQRYIKFSDEDRKIAVQKAFGGLSSLG